MVSIFSQPGNDHTVAPKVDQNRIETFSPTPFPQWSPKTDLSIAQVLRLQFFLSSQKRFWKHLAVNSATDPSVQRSITEVAVRHIRRWFMFFVSPLLTEDSIFHNSLTE